MIRDVLLSLFGAVWAIVVITTALRTGEVPAELWAVLGIGVGALLAAFRTDDRVSKRPADHDDEEGSDL
jgi:ABC-type enterobactin transport system permease subunit